MLRRLVDPLHPTNDWPTKVKLMIDVCDATIVRLSPGNGYVACGDTDGALLIFDSDSWAVVFRYRHHAMPLVAIQWSPTSEYIVTVGSDWQIGVWHLQLRRLVRQYNLDFCPVAAAFDPENWRRFAVADSSGVRVFELDERNFSSLEAPEAGISSSELQARPDGSASDDICCMQFAKGGVICCGTSEGHAHFFTVDGPLVRTLKVCYGTVRDMAYNERTNMLMIAGTDRAVHAVYLDEFREKLGEIDVGCKFVNLVLFSQWNSLAISQDGEYLFAVSETPVGTVSVWNVHTQAVVGKFEGSEECVSRIIFDQSRVMAVALGQETGTLYVWRADTPEHWSKVLFEFEDLPDVEPYFEAEDAWDYPEPENELQGETGDIDVVTRKEPFCEVPIPLEL